MSNITKDFDALKAMMDNYASYSFDLQKNVEDKLNDYRYEAGERQINAYTDTYYQSLYAAENRINKYKQQDAEKLAKKQAQINKKYDKQIAAAKTEAEKKALQERQSAELKAAEEKSKYVRGLDAEHRAAKEQRDEEASAISKALKDGNLLDLSDSLKEAFSDGSGFSSLAAALSDFTASLNTEIESIAKRKSSIDTRLQGSKNSTVAGSYWDRISKDITGAAAISPLVKQSDITEQVQSMVKQGISYNVEQRAFLATISDKIADTFNATNSSLLRLVRIQQQDSTAARLGMESALNSFLNNMYETTEYMGAIMDGIKSSLEEAEALMGTEEAAQFEYQVQK